MDLNSKKDNYKISASILDCDFINLGSEIKRAGDFGVDMLHIDVMDGLFVKNISFGQPILKKIRDYSNMFLDVHLMIKNPDKHLDGFIESGSDSICVHAEECPHLHWTLNYIRKAGIKTAVALNPSTPLSFIENVFPCTDMVLIMTVNPGFGGQQFIKEMLPKIRKLKIMIGEYRQATKDPRNIDIQVDGGINPGTAADVVRAGANILVMGSAIYKADDPSGVIQQVREKFRIVI